MSIRVMLSKAIRENEKKQLKLVAEAQNLYKLRAALGRPKTRARRKLKRVK